MKKIILYAYGEFNLGDDLFIKTLLERYPTTEFIFYAHNEYKGIFNNYENIKVINKDNYFINKLKKIIPNIHNRIINYIEKQCDAMVYIGGSIFIQYPDWKNCINWYKNKSKKLPIFIIGANFGPYTEEGFVEGFKETYPMLVDVCFRDNYSYNLFKECNNVRLAPDVILSLNDKNIEKIKKQVFISIIDCESRNKNNIPLDLLDEYEDDYILKIRDIVENFIDDGFDVVMSSFCENENDYISIKKIYNKIDNNRKEKIKILNYTGFNLEEILRSIKQSQYVISSRFHASILGLVYNKPIFPIVYSLKTENMLKDLGFKGNYIKVSEISKIDYKYVKENLDRNIILDTSQIKIDAEQQFLSLDKFLNN